MFSIVIFSSPISSCRSSAKVNPVSNVADAPPIAPTKAPPAVVKAPKGPAVNPDDPIAAPAPAPDAAPANVAGVSIALTDDTKS